MRSPVVGCINRLLRHRPGWAIGAGLFLLLSAGVRPAAAEEVATIHGCKLIYGSECAGADLSGVDLRNGFLARSILAGANLRNADLTGVNLWKTNLAKADLSQAKMAGAFLAVADLRGANLEGADLRGAFLFRALTDGANFHGADLAGARWITGAICGPDSIGDCHPLPRNAAYDVPMPHFQALGRTPLPAPTGSIKLVNDVTVKVTKLLPADPAKAKPTDGVAFTGIGYVSAYFYSSLQIHVRVTVYAEKQNVAVLAVFADDRAPPVKLVSKPIAAKGSADLDFSFALRIQSVSSLQFRIGPGEPGEITVNAPEGAAAGKKSAATVMITEKEAK
jgi:uncharacterized protein YjbI with pentapeptide repeats